MLLSPQKKRALVTGGAAAYGGYMPEISKYVAVNSLGTAQLLEIIREKNLGIQKIIVASSQVVYPEGVGDCPQHGLVFPGLRPVEQLRRGDFSVRCPACQSPTKSVPTPPVIYEDGEQTRDFSFVEDIARANLLAATSDGLDGKAVNVGSGRAVTIKRVAEQISAALRIPLAPIMNREFRPGEMRHLNPILP